MQAPVFVLVLLFLGIVNSQNPPSRLSYRQSFPSGGENKVCGQIRDVIPRNSGRFRKILIRNTNNEAQYERDDCRRMTARAKSKLDILASRVLTEWRGKAVRVLQAWTDQVNTNDPLSLHYEGRSVRLRISDGDRGKLSRLAGLAIEAGFDWVEYTDRNYIRASVIPDVCQTSVDLVFLLDGSGSVGANNFGKVKEFVKKVVDFFNIGKTGTHIGVVQYSTKTVTEFNLKRYFTKSEMKNAVDRIPYQSGWTYTAEALKHLSKNIFTPQAGMRTDAGIPKVLVLITDGKSQGDSVGPPAEALKNIGINIFGIGVGSGISVSQLKEIASDPDSDYVFQRTFDNLIARWVDRLSAVSCSEGSLINFCKNSETSVESGSFKYFRTEFQFVTGNAVSVELRDISGVSHLYASKTSKNPGPLDRDSVKNEEDTSPKAVSVRVDNTKIVYVAVQGQRDTNKFSLSFWDNLFTETTYNFEVDENENAKLIGTLGLATNKYRYKITDGNSEGAFRIDSSLPRLYTTKQLDREKTAKYSLVIVAENEKNKCHKSRTNVIVTVKDKNDNKPKFRKDLYRATISEHTPVNTVIKIVEATDADAGDNAKITYSITSQSPENKFSINNQGGQIRLTGALDYETHDSYTVHLQARDGGGNTDTSRLEVTVQNVNEPPSIRCNNGNCRYAVNENVRRGTTFGAQMIGSDPDTKTTCTLQYSVQSSVKSKFTIATTGVISTNGDLDREARPTYGFYVTVKDCGGLTANKYVTVNIRDLNDNKPQFPDPYTVNILESEQPGSNVVQVSARDADEGNNAKITYSMEGSESSAFIINQSNGKITTKSTLDFETKQSYLFRVVATDGGQTAQSGTTTVTVNVVDVNDNKPKFGGTYAESIREDKPVGQSVITVNATDDDSGPRGDIRYSIVGGNIGTAFAIIDARSGVITVKSPLDRETSSAYKLTVQASDRGSPSMNARATVTITIVDVNDNTPVFQGLPYRRSIPEDFSTSEVILQVTATDKDAGAFGKVSYSIKSPQIAKETFSIDENNGNIRLIKSLDYEQKTAYTFTIAARDGGKKEATATVKIFVTDVNDNAPVFKNDPYSADVAENAKVGHLVRTVIATDADSGPFGRVTYSIANGNTGKAFRIDAAGRVTILSSLDRETLQKYTLTIRAQDDGQPAKYSTAKLSIIVTDINDNKPTFERDSYSFKIAENNAVNALVGKLGQATDEDAGNNAKIVYSIVHGNVNTAFEFQANGDLIAKKSLDRELIASYSLMIEAKDQGNPSLSTTVPVKVVVDDKNDNAPKFTEKAYSCRIDENSASNSRVCFVRATDADIGKNGEVVYELVSSSNEFSVSQNGGEITTKVSLDREKTPSYTLTIRAKDRGVPTMNSIVTVTVTVVDKNDNEPKYDQDYSFQVKENAALNTRVGQVNASDADEGSNGKVVYDITGGNAKSAFSISKNTGVISVNSGLDRETLANYKLVIRASDQGTRVLSSSKVVPIKILDVNDNSPIFTKSPYFGEIAEDASVGSRVVQVKATDEDEGVNSQIKYSITGGDLKNNFTIDEVSGLITTATKLDYETEKSYLLTVMATDQGTPTRTSTCQVNITVKNTNDNAPTFVPGSPIVYVSEAVAIGTKVVKFNATDKDGNKLSFSISEGNTNGDFAVDKDTGLLTTKKKLDRETIPRYNLTVTVTESTNTRATEQSSSQNLSVIVTDENDNGPVFDPKEYTEDIDENTPAGALLTVKATDADAGKNAEITFSLDSISTNKFTIDSTTGLISTKTPLDHEEGSNYDITVTARDSGTPSLSSTAKVKVTVNDLNDNKPRFTKDYTTTLRENTAKGRTVLRVEASDPDSGENGKINYTITSGNDLGYFTIDAVKGIISVEIPPDREQYPSFTLNIRATNKPAFVPSTPSAKTDCSVLITIEDANDNRPNITNTITTVQVEENSPANTQVLDVNATDADIGVNGEIVYEIVQGNINNAFKIVRDSGVISTRGAIDREAIASYTLKVQVTDKGSPELFSRKDFVVDVSDLDDNAPAFNPTAYDESVPESANLSTMVVRLLATDKDIGNNAKIRYSIASGNDEDHFNIDSDKGAIYTSAVLDYEKLKEYTLVVEAKDTKHTTQADVTIRVEDINDNPPVFKPSSYKISIPENQGLGKTIVNVNATDKDPFGGLTYSLHSPNNMFTVDPASGKISAISELDRETTDYYNLSVRATDGGSPALSDTAVVEILITDINDNRPIFNSSQADISVLENSPVGKVLLKVAATDADIGVNAELRYNIMGGNEAGKFKLDAVSGNLSVSGDIDREQVDAYSLEIVAQDQGKPYRQSTPLVVAIKVLDENDNDPIFTKSRYEQNITENLSSGAFVKEVEATDADIGANGRVTYAILSGAEGYFRIDNDTGIVETTKPLDREDIASFLITIEARDQGNPSRNSTALLQVNVLDLNDNSPRLDTIVANVTEEQPKGEFVTRIVAIDPDQGRNGEVEYSLTIRGNQSLKIDAKTGDVITRVTFDYEEQKNHTFQIIATDKGNPSLSTTADLIINVLDIDDNCPVFDPKEYNVTIQENVPYETPIVQVNAKDVDTVGAKLEYGIRSGNTATTFKIHRYKGILQAGLSVDRETAAEYNLIVRAGHDYCGVNRTGIDIDESVESELSKSIAKVNIFLTDLNDNAPKFLQDSYEYELKDIYINSLLWLNATDPDEGVNAEFDFGLHGVTRDQQKRTLVVTATDKGTPSMSSNTTLDMTGIKCEAMRFSVSARGHITVKTLCEFNEIVVPKDALVEESATFNCSAQGNTVPEYRWFRNSVPITDWLKNGEYFIKSLTKNDEGYYSCIASSEAGNILSESHKFTVREPAKVFVHPKDIWVEVDKKANLSCRASGDEPIKYTWFKNDKPIRSSADVIADQPDLVFYNAIVQDAEKYRCEVKNYEDAQPDKSRTARIEVYTPDAVVDMELTVDKPLHKESCQYFNITNIKETVESMIEGEMAVVEFEKPSRLCNLTACSSDPCFNNGRCQVNGSDFICHCPREWTGKQCLIDVDECKSDTCSNGGVCKNRKGSFSCECRNSTTSGKLCQFREKICNPNPCDKAECYPKEVKQRYECLADVKAVAMVFTLDDARLPFKNWMLYDVAKEIENAINDAAVVQTREGGRSRRDTIIVDYSDCSVRVKQHKLVQGKQLELQIILVCAQPPEQKYVCDAMFKQGMVTSCTDESGTREAKPKTDPPTINPQRVTLAFIVRKPNGKDTEASETINVLRERNIEEELGKHKMFKITLQARSLKNAESGESDSDLSSVAIIGVVIGCIVLIILAIVIVFLVIRTRQRGDIEFSIGGRAMLSRSQSTDAILSRDINLRELENAEARGVNNKTFSEIYEENDGHPSDLENGAFMVENPQQALKKHDQAYMKQLDSCPWFHGSISRSKAEDLLDANDNEGTFLVRSGLDMGEFYISVRTPNAEPKFRHISVNRRDENFVAVCGSEQRNFTTFNELVEYLRENPTQMEGISEDVILKEHIAKQ